MEDTAIGARVVAIRDSDDEEIRIFGFGTYEGKHLPDFAAEDVAAMVNDSKQYDQEMVDMGEDGFVEDVISGYEQMSEVLPMDIQMLDKDDVKDLAREDYNEAVARVSNWSDDDYKQAILSNPALLNPKIKLDSGDVIWGYQCWWTEIQDETNWREGVPGDRNVVEVPLDT